MARAASTRESADFRRQSLIEATAACLAEHGAAGTSVRTICARAGVSPGLLRHYFDGIDGLIAVTYRDGTDPVPATPPEAGDASRRGPRAPHNAFEHGKRRGGKRGGKT